MEHRRLGTSGLNVSVLSFGSWVTFDTQLDNDDALDALNAAWEAGVTFFDNAEAYAGGESERIMGQAFQRLGWPRDTYTVSTKFFFGITDGPNTRQTLNRKYLMSAIDGSLERFQLDFVDLIFCHRSDPLTPMREVVEAMSDIIASGKAHYWGTSEWSAAEIQEAHDVAATHNLRPPVMEQPHYNLFTRDRVETEYAPLYDQHGMGLTTWSPLASGLLTGKYLDGIPAGSRGTLEGYEWLRERLEDTSSHGPIRALKAVADDLDASLAQLAIAWCAANPHVSTVITGASNTDQVRHNMEAAELIPQLDDGVLLRIEAALQA